MNFSSSSGQNVFRLELGRSRLNASKGIGGVTILINADSSVILHPNPHNADGPFSISKIEGLLKLNNNVISSIKVDMRNVINTMYANDNPINIEVFITYAQIQEIEENRQSGSLSFTLDLEAEILGWASASQNKPIQNFFDLNKYINSTKNDFQSERLFIEETDWLKVLDQGGYGEHLNVSLFFGSKSTKPEILDAIRKLKEAQTQLWRGDSQNCIEDCRQTLERISSLYADSAKRIQAEKKDGKKLTKHERKALLASKLWDFTSLAHHEDEIGRATKWEREDAMYVLLMTTALVKWLERSGE